jgi:hypothetical protein
MSQYSFTKNNFTKGDIQNKDMINKSTEDFVNNVQNILFRMIIRMMCLTLFNLVFNEKCFQIDCWRAQGANQMYDQAQRHHMIKLNSLIHNLVIIKNIHTKSVSH